LVRGGNRFAVENASNAITPAHDIESKTNATAAVLANFVIDDILVWCD